MNIQAKNRSERKISETQALWRRLRAALTVLKARECHAALFTCERAAVLRFIGAFIAN